MAESTNGVFRHVTRSSHQRPSRRFRLRSSSASADGTPYQPSGRSLARQGSRTHNSPDQRFTVNPGENHGEIVIILDEGEHLVGVEVEIRPPEANTNNDGNAGNGAAYGGERRFTRHRLAPELRRPAIRPKFSVSPGADGSTKITLDWDEAVTVGTDEDGAVEIEIGCKPEQEGGNGVLEVTRER